MGNNTILQAVHHIFCILIAFISHYLYDFSDSASFTSEIVLSNKP